MRTTTQATTRFEFSFPHKDTLVLVEVQENQVRIRASEPSFTADQKVAFTQHLAAEGFIPPQIRTWEISPEPVNGAVQWVIDDAWIESSQHFIAKSRQHMLRLLCGSGLVWLGVVLLLFWRD